MRAGFAGRRACIRQRYRGREMAPGRLRSVCHVLQPRSVSMIVSECIVSVSAGDVCIHHYIRDMFLRPTAGAK